MWESTELNIPITLENKIKELSINLLIELLNNKLEVVLLPAPEPKFQGHMIRVATASNPAWYRDFYSQRKVPPSRKYVIQALRHLSKDIKTKTSYQEELLYLIHNYLMEGYVSLNGYVESDLDYINEYNRYNFCLEMTKYEWM